MTSKSHLNLGRCSYLMSIRVVRWPGSHGDQVVVVFTRKASKTLTNFYQVSKH